MAYIGGVINKQMVFIDIRLGEFIQGLNVEKNQNLEDRSISRIKKEAERAGGKVENKEGYYLRRQVKEKGAKRE